jgi:sugar lactone lactonase YvrE
VHEIQPAEVETIQDERCKREPALPIAQHKKVFTVSTWAGDGSTHSRDGKGTDCGINWPYEIKFDRYGNGIFSAYGSSSIRRISPSGEVSTISNRASETDTFHCVRGLALDQKGNIYIADTGRNMIRKISPDGTCENIVSKVFLSAPYGIAVAEDGTIYLSDTYADCINAIYPDGRSEVIAGTGISGHLDGPGRQAQFNLPQGLELDQEGNLIVADKGNNMIRKIDKQLNVTTVATGFRDPYSVALDGNGNIFVADYGNNAIKMIDKKGAVHPIAGASYSYFKDEPQNLYQPTGLGIDPLGNLVICDCYNHRIRKVNCVFGVMGPNWPDNHQMLPQPLSEAVEEFLCIFHFSPPIRLPKDLIVLMVKNFIAHWPISTNLMVE